MAEVYGVAHDTRWIGGNALLEERDVQVPKNALSAVAEGFCPNDQTPLAGDTGGVTWHMRREPAEGTAHDG